MVGRIADLLIRALLALSTGMLAVMACGTVLMALGVMPPERLVPVLFWGTTLLVFAALHHPAARTRGIGPRTGRRLARLVRRKMRSSALDSHPKF